MAGVPMLFSGIASAVTPQKGQWCNGSFGCIGSEFGFTVKGGAKRKVTGFGLAFDPVCGGLIGDRKADIKKKTGKFKVTKVVTVDSGTYTVTLKGKFTSESSAKGSFKVVPDEGAAPCLTIGEEPFEFIAAPPPGLF
jgi:hypothetical protein